MRARYPDHEGVVERDGVSLGYEIYGSRSPTILLMPTWTIVNVRFWKAQFHYLSRHFRVVTFDGPGNGRSDRPVDSRHYGHDALVADALAVLEATETDTVVLVSLSQGASRSLQLAADHPDRVLGQVFLGPTLPLTPPPPERADIPETFAQAIADPQGWEKYNAHYWQTDFRDFAEFFFAQAQPEPHSTKQREDTVGWAMETTPEVLIAEAQTKTEPDDREKILELCARVQSPTLVIHGTDDRISPFSRGLALAEATRGELIAIDGGGHMPQGRDPVIVNLAIREFVERLAA